MALNTCTEIKTPVLENSARTYSTDLTLPNGTALLAAQVSDIKAWLIDDAYNIINGRNDQSVKNAQGGTLTDGHFELQFGALDTARQSTDVSRVQTRYLHLEFQMVGGLRHAHEVMWYVALNHRTQ